jgi:hypothetical protein
MKMAQVTITDAAIYSTKGEMAYELTYSEGTKVRAVETTDGCIRKEFKNAAGEWVLSGAPYVVKRNKKRQAERLKEAARKFLAH